MLTSTDKTQALNLKLVAIIGLAEAREPYQFSVYVHLFTFGGLKRKKA